MVITIWLFCLSLNGWLAPFKSRSWFISEPYLVEQDQTWNRRTLTYPRLGLHPQLDQHDQDALGADQGPELPDPNVAASEGP
jgi:hypothetical protein